MNEFEAAMGLCMLDEIEEIFGKRKVVFERYAKALDGVVQCQLINENAMNNYSYFSVIFKSEEELKRVQKALNEQSIFPRRYFYPSLDTLNYIEPKQYMPISRDISTRILCLPLYPGLEEAMQMTIIKIVKDNT